MNTKILSIESDHSSKYAEIYLMASSLPCPPTFSYQINPQNKKERATQKQV